MEGPFFFLFSFCEESVLDQHGPKLPTPWLVERMPAGWEKELWGPTRRNNLGLIQCKSV